MKYIMQKPMDLNEEMTWMPSEGWRYTIMFGKWVWVKEEK